MQRYALLPLALLLTARTLPAQQGPPATLLKVAEGDGVVMSLDSASIVHSGDSRFVVHTVTRFTEPVPRDEGDSVDTEVDHEEIDCAGERVRGFSAALMLGARQVAETRLPGAWAAVPPGRLPAVRASCGVLLASFAAALPVMADSDAVDVEPELINPDYVFERLDREHPTLFRNAMTEADVTVRVHVSATGHPEPATLEVVSSTQPELANALRRLVPGMRFLPAKLHGRPVAAWFTFPLHLETGVTHEIVP